MNINLPPELESIVNKKMESGRYNSVGEVLRDGLMLLDQQDRLMEMRRADLISELKKGELDLREGRYYEFNSADELRDFAKNLIEKNEAALIQSNVNG